MIKLSYKLTFSSVPKLRPNYFITNILVCLSVDLIHKDLFFSLQSTDVMFSCFLLASFSLCRTVLFAWFFLCFFWSFDCISASTIFCISEKIFCFHLRYCFYAGLQVIEFNCISDALSRPDPCPFLVQQCCSGSSTFVSSGETGQVWGAAGSERKEQQWRRSVGTILATPLLHCIVLCI